jgi:COP9 signalosome complex subunit 1
VEPMQVDAPPEDNDNNEEEPYIVENPSLVCIILIFQTIY